jgi:hypothetical protein
MSSDVKGAASRSAPHFGEIRKSFEFFDQELIRISLIVGSGQYGLIFMPAPTESEKYLVFRLIMRIRN